MVFTRAFNKFITQYAWLKWLHRCKGRARILWCHETVQILASCRWMPGFLVLSFVCVVSRCSFRFVSGSLGFDEKMIFTWESLKIGCSWLRDFLGYGYGFWVLGCGLGSEVLGFTIFVFCFFCLCVFILILLWEGSREVWVLGSLESVRWEICKCC